MLEYMYRLNLPPFFEVIRDDIREDFLSKYYTSRAIGYKPEEIFKPEYLNLKGLHWWKANLFFKDPNSPGIVHTDNPINSSKLHVNILWVQGYGGMQYWDEDRILSKYAAVDQYNKQSMTVYNVKYPPSKDYETMSGQVFLVNANIPHTGYNSFYETENRYTIALQTVSTLPWQHFVELFSDLIIT